MMIVTDPSVTARVASDGTAYVSKAKTLKSQGTVSKSNWLLCSFLYLHSRNVKLQPLTPTA